MPTRIVIVGGRIDMLHVAKDLGLDTVLIHQRGEYDPESVDLAERVENVTLSDVASVLAVIKRVHAERPLARVFALAENSLVAAATANDWLGLGGNTLRTTLLLKNKSAMRELLAEVGLSPVAARVVTSAAELAAFTSTVG